MRRLSDITLALYASRSYLERFGAPADPDASLAGHRVILFADVRPFTAENEWFLPRLEGAQVALRSDSVSSLYSAAVGGVGIALLPRAAADGDPSLVCIETRSSPEPRVIWQSVHRDMATSARVRVVLDFLARLLGGGALVRAAHGATDSSKSP